MTNLQIAELLRNVAAAYQYKDQSKYKFQIIAYERAADAIEHSTSELKDLWDDGKLEEVPGIGASLAKHLDEIFRTGKSKHFDEIMKDIPEDAFKLMILPKIGIKTAIKILNESSKAEIKSKLDEAEKLSMKVKRHLLPYAENIASEVMEWVKKCEDVEKVDVLGSLRRKVATVGDIDILVSTKSEARNSKIMDHFTKYPKIQKIIEKGEHTASILLPGNVQVDILITTPESYGDSLQHFTGSKHHNIALREYSLSKGWSMNEYRLKMLNGKKANDKYFATEEELYNFLGLDFIPPELREGIGEIEVARDHKLPKLIDVSDIKADLQIHSNFDIETSHDLGVNSMEEIVKKASGLKYEYIAFTEHNPSQKGHTDKQIIDILKRKREVVDKINDKIRRGLLRETSDGHSEIIEQLNYSRTIKVFNSLEIDMKTDGSLPVPEEGLNTLDFALVSIHSSFDLSRDEQTNRVLKALGNPKVKIFAHPTARKINEREGVELNWPEIFEFCKSKGKWIEINCDPMRLDLPDVLVHDAVKYDVKLTLGTDTHSTNMMDNMRYGVYVARRGWAEKNNIINCLNLTEFEKVLE